MSIQPSDPPAPPAQRGPQQTAQPRGEAGGILSRSRAVGNKGDRQEWGQEEL